MLVVAGVVRGNTAFKDVQKNLAAAPSIHHTLQGDLSITWVQEFEEAHQILNATNIHQIWDKMIHQNNRPSIQTWGLETAYPVEWS